MLLLGRCNSRDAMVKVICRNEPVWGGLQLATDALAARERSSMR
jgi:hypothetical protein